MTTSIITVNNVGITENVTEVLQKWFGTVDNPHKESSPESYVQVLVKIQDLIIDKLDETYPDIDRKLFDILSYVKNMRQDFEKIIPTKVYED